MSCDLCTVPLDDRDSCPKCHAYHGEPCESCGRRGYHADDCQEPTVCLAGNPSVGERPCGEPSCVCATYDIEDHDGRHLARTVETDETDREERRQMREWRNDSGV